MINQFPKQIWFRLIAAALCFVLPATEIVPAYGQVSSATALSAPAQAPGFEPIERAQGNVFAKPELDPNQISIPSELGSVQETFSGNKKQTIVHIQDAHGSLSAQENIGKLVKYLHETYGIDLLAVEGAAGEVDLSSVRNFSNAEVRQKVARRYLESFDLTGDEYYIIAENPNITMVGAERMLKYYFNRDQYFHAKALSEKIAPTLKRFSAVVHGLEREVCGKSLNQFLRESELSRAHHEILLKHLARTKEVLSPLFEKEYPLLSSVLKNELSELPTGTFLVEWEKAEESAKQVLAITEREKQMLDLTHITQLFEKLFTLALSSKEFSELEKSAGLIRADYFRTKIESIRAPSLWRKDFSRLFDSKNDFIAFYRNAKNRDAILSANIRKVLKKKNVSNTISIAGGFHTEGLIDEWKREGISFVVVRPNIDKSRPGELDRYFSRNVSSATQMSASKIVVAERGFAPWRLDLRNRMLADMHLEASRLKSAAGFGIEGEKKAQTRVQLRAKIERLSKGGELLAKKISALSAEAPGKLEYRIVAKIENMVNAFEGLAGALLQAEGIRKEDVELLRTDVDRVEKKFNSISKHLLSPALIEWLPVRTARPFPPSRRFRRIPFDIKVGFLTLFASVFSAMLLAFSPMFEFLMRYVIPYTPFAVTLALGPFLYRVSAFLYRVFYPQADVLIYAWKSEGNVWQEFSGKEVDTLRFIAFATDPSRPIRIAVPDAGMLGGFQSQLSQMQPISDTYNKLTLVPITPLQRFGLKIRAAFENRSPFGFRPALIVFAALSLLIGNYFTGWLIDPANLTGQLWHKKELEPLVFLDWAFSWYYAMADSVMEEVKFIFWLGERYRILFSPRLRHITAMTVSDTLNPYNFMLLAVISAFITRYFMTARQHFVSVASKKLTLHRILSWSAAVTLSLILARHAYYATALAIAAAAFRKEIFNLTREVFQKLSGSKLWKTVVAPVNVTAKAFILVLLLAVTSYAALVPLHYSFRGDMARIYLQFPHTSNQAQLLIGNIFRSIFPAFLSEGMKEEIDKLFVESGLKIMPNVAIRIGHRASFELLRFESLFTDHSDRRGDLLTLLALNIRNDTSTRELNRHDPLELAKYIQSDLEKLNYALAVIEKESSRELFEQFQDDIRNAFLQIKDAAFPRSTLRDEILRRAEEVQKQYVTLREKFESGFGVASSSEELSSERSVEGGAEAEEKKTDDRLQSKADRVMQLFSIFKWHPGIRSLPIGRVVSGSRGSLTVNRKYEQFRKIVGEQLSQHADDQWRSPDELASIARSSHLESVEQIVEFLSAVDEWYLKSARRESEEEQAEKTEAQDNLSEEAGLIYLRYMTGELDLGGAAGTISELIGDAHDEPALSKLFEPPVRRLLSRSKHDFEMRILKSEAQSPVVIARAGYRWKSMLRDLLLLRWSAILWVRVLYELLNSDAGRIFFSAPLWMFVGSLIGGVTLAAAFGFITRYVLRPLYEGLLYNLGDYAERGDSTLSYSPFLFGRSLIRRDSNWADVRRAYYETIALGRPGELDHPALKLYILEKILESLPELSDLRKLVERVRLRALNHDSTQGSAELWDILADELEKAQIRPSHPHAVFLTSILFLTTVRPYQRLFVSSANFREVKAEAKSALAYGIRRLPKRLLGSFILVLARTARRFLGLIMNSRQLEDLVRRLQNYFLLRLGFRMALRVDEHVFSREDTQAKPIRFDREKEYKERIISFLRQLEMPEMEPLIEYLDREINFKFEDFIDRDWHPVGLSMWMNLGSEGDWKDQIHARGTTQFDLENKTLLLSKKIPPVLNALIAVKLASLGFRHQVIRGERRNLHLPAKEIEAIQGKIYRKLFRTIITKGPGPLPGSRRESRDTLKDTALDFLFILLAFFHLVSSRVYSFPNQAGVLVAKRHNVLTRALIKTQEGLTVGFYLLFGRRFIRTTDQPPYPIQQETKQKRLAHLYGFLKPFAPALSNLGSALVYFTFVLAIFGGIALHLDLSFVMDVLVYIKDLLAKIDFLHIGELVQALWLVLVAAYETLGEFFNELLQYLFGIDIEWLKDFFRSLWNDLEPARRFVQKTIIPFFYHFVVPVLMFSGGMAYGFLVYKLKFRRLLVKLADLVVEIHIQFVSRLIASAVGIVRTFTGGEETVKDETAEKVESFLRQNIFVRTVRVLLHFLANVFYFVALIVGIGVYLGFLIWLAYPPFDLETFFHSFQRIGVPVTPIMYVYITIVVIGLPFSLYYIVNSIFLRALGIKSWTNTRRFSMASAGLLGLITAVLPPTFNIVYRNNYSRNRLIRSNKEAVMYDWKNFLYDRAPLFALAFETELKERTEQITEDIKKKEKEVSGEIGKWKGKIPEDIPMPAEDQSKKLGEEMEEQLKPVAQKVVSVALSIFKHIALPPIREGLEDIVDPRTGHGISSTDANWVRENKGKALAALKEKHPAIYGNASFFKDLIEDSTFWSSDGANFYDMFTREELAIITDHMIAILDGSVTYKTYAENYFQKRAALAFVDQLVWGPYLQEHPPLSSFLTATYFRYQGLFVFPEGVLDQLRVARDHRPYDRAVGYIPKLALYHRCNAPAEVADFVNRLSRVRVDEPDIQHLIDERTDIFIRYRISYYLRHFDKELENEIAQQVSDLETFERLTSELSGGRETALLKNLFTRAGIPNDLGETNRYPIERATFSRLLGEVLRETKNHYVWEFSLRYLLLSGDSVAVEVLSEEAGRLAEWYAAAKRENLTIEHEEYDERFLNLEVKTAIFLHRVRQFLGEGSKAEGDYRKTLENLIVPFADFPIGESGKHYLEHYFQMAPIEDIKTQPPPSMPPSSSSGFGFARVVITDVGIQSAVQKLLGEKKKRDESKPPYVHFPYVPVQEVVPALDVKLVATLTKYLQRHGKTPEDFNMYDPSNVLNEKNIRWAVNAIKQKKAASNKKRVLKREPVLSETASKREVALVLGKSQHALIDFMTEHPASDKYGIYERPSVDHPKREKKLREIVERLKAEQGEVYVEDLVEPSGLSPALLASMREYLYSLGVLRGGRLRGEINRFKTQIRNLSDDGRTALLALIVNLRDQKKISFSQSYALVHMIVYSGTAIDTHEEIRKALNLTSAQGSISRILHGTSMLAREKRGVLDLIKDQPDFKVFRENQKPLDGAAVAKLARALVIKATEMPYFSIRLRPDEKSKGTAPAELNIPQRIEVVKAFLRGKTRVRIGRELPSIVGDLRIQPVAAKRVSQFLDGFAKPARELKGALPTLNEELEHEGILSKGEPIEKDLISWAKSEPSTYWMAAQRIMHLSGDEHLQTKPSDIISVLKIFEREKTPLPHMVRELNAYYDERKYPFDVGISFYGTLQEGSRIDSNVLAAEIAAYFSGFVLPSTNMEEEFMDGLLYMLQPGRAHYYFTLDETAQFFANVYFRLDRPDHQLMWGKLLARFAGASGVKTASLRRRFAKQVYQKFLEIVFPKMVFLDSDEMNKATHSERRGKILVEKNRYFDFDYLMQKSREYLSKVERLERLVHEFLSKTSFEAVARKWKVPADDLDLVYEAVLEAAWDYDPVRYLDTSFNSLATTYVIKKSRQNAYRKRHSRQEQQRQFRLDEDGNAIELETTLGPERPPLLEITHGEESNFLKARMDELNQLLESRFSNVERTVFKLVNGLDPQYEVNLTYGQVAEVLWDKGFTAGEDSLTASRIEQIYREVMEKLIRLMNTPSLEDVAAWERFLRDPFAADEPPRPIRVDVKNGRVPLPFNINLDGYDIRDGRPVTVSSVRSVSSIAEMNEYYVIVEVQYRGRSIGASLLKFNRFGEILDQLRKDSKEDALRLLAGIMKFDRSDESGMGFGAAGKQEIPVRVALAREKLEKYKRRLHDSQANVLQARYIEGKGQKEIAQETGTIRSVVERREHSGLARLWEMVHADEDGLTNEELVRRFSYIFPRVLTKRQIEMLKLLFLGKRRLSPKEAAQKLSVHIPAVKQGEILGLIELHEYAEAVKSTASIVESGVDVSSFVTRHERQLDRWVGKEAADLLRSIRLKGESIESVSTRLGRPPSNIQAAYFMALQLLWNQVGVISESALVKSHKYLFKILQPYYGQILTKFYEEGKTDIVIAKELGYVSKAGYPEGRRIERLRLSAINQIWNLVSPLSESELVRGFESMLENLTPEHAHVLSGRVLGEKQTYEELGSGLSKRRSQMEIYYTLGMYELRKRVTDSDLIRKALAEKLEISTPPEVKKYEEDLHAALRKARHAQALKRFPQAAEVINVLDEWLTYAEETSAKPAVSKDLAEFTRFQSDYATAMEQFLSAQIQRDDTLDFLLKRHLYTFTRMENMVSANGLKTLAKERKSFSGAKAILVRQENLYSILEEGTQSKDIKNEVSRAGRALAEIARAVKKYGSDEAASSLLLRNLKQHLFILVDLVNEKRMKIGKIKLFSTENLNAVQNEYRNVLRLLSAQRSRDGAIAAGVSTEELWAAFERYLNDKRKPSRVAGRTISPSPKVENSLLNLESALFKDEIRLDLLLRLIAEFFLALETYASLPDANEKQVSEWQNRFFLDVLPEAGYLFSSEEAFYKFEEGDAEHDGLYMRFQVMIDDALSGREPISEQGPSDVSAGTDDSDAESGFGAAQKTHDTSDRDDAKKFSTPPFVQQEMFLKNMELLDREFFGRMTRRSQVFIFHDSDGDGIASAGMLKALVAALGKVAPEKVQLFMDGQFDLSGKLREAPPLGEVFVIFTDINGALARYQREVPSALRRKMSGVISIDHHTAETPTRWEMTVYPESTWGSSVDGFYFPAALESFYIALNLIKRHRDTEVARRFYVKYHPIALFSLRHDVALIDQIEELKPWHTFMQSPHGGLEFVNSNDFKTIDALLRLDRLVRPEGETNQFLLWLMSIFNSLSQRFSEEEIQKVYREAFARIAGHIEAHQSDVQLLRRYVSERVETELDRVKGDEDIVFLDVKKDDFDSLGLTPGVKPRVRIDLAANLAFRLGKGKRNHETRPLAVVVFEQEFDRPNFYQIRFRAVRERMDTGALIAKTNLGRRGRFEKANARVTLGRTTNPLTGRAYSSLDEVKQTILTKTREMSSGFGANPAAHDIVNFLSGENVEPVEGRVAYAKVIMLRNAHGGKISYSYIVRASKFDGSGNRKQVNIAIRPDAVEGHDLETERAVMVLERDPEHGLVANVYWENEYRSSADRWQKEIGSAIYYPEKKRYRSVNLSHKSVLDVFEGNETHLKGGRFIRAEVRVRLGLRPADESAVDRTEYRVEIFPPYGKQPFKLGIPIKLGESLGFRDRDPVFVRVERDMNHGIYLALYKDKNFTVPPILTYKNMRAGIDEKDLYRKYRIYQIDLALLDVVHVYNGRKDIRPGRGIKAKVLSSPDRYSKQGYKFEIGSRSPEMRDVSFWIASQKIPLVKEMLWKNPNAKADLRVIEDADYGIYLEVSLAGRYIADYWFDPERKQFRNANLDRMRVRDWVRGKKNIHGQPIDPAQILSNRSAFQEASIPLLRAGPFPEWLVHEAKSFLVYRLAQLQFLKRPVDGIFRLSYGEFLEGVRKRIDPTIVSLVDSAEESEFFIHVLKSSEFKARLKGQQILSSIAGDKRYAIHFSKDELLLIPSEIETVERAELDEENWADKLAEDLSVQVRYRTVYLVNDKKIRFESNNKFIRIEDFVFIGSSQILLPPWFAEQHKNRIIWTPLRPTEKSEQLDFVSGSLTLLAALAMMGFREEWEGKTVLVDSTLDGSLALLAKRMGARLAISLGVGSSDAAYMKILARRNGFDPDNDFKFSDLGIEDIDQFKEANIQIAISNQTPIGTNMAETFRALPDLELYISAPDVDRSSSRKVKDTLEKEGHRTVEVVNLNVAAFDGLSGGSFPKKETGELIRLVVRPNPFHSAGFGTRNSKFKRDSAERLRRKNYLNMENISVVRIFRALQLLPPELPGQDDVRIKNWLKKEGLDFEPRYFYFLKGLSRAADEGKWGIRIVDALEKLSSEQLTALRQRAFQESASGWRKIWKRIRREIAALLMVARFFAVPAVLYLHFYTTAFWPFIYGTFVASFFRAVSVLTITIIATRVLLKYLAYILNPWSLWSFRLFETALIDELLLKPEIISSSERNQLLLRFWIQEEALGETYIANRQERIVWPEIRRAIDQLETEAKQIARALPEISKTESTSMLYRMLGGGGNYLNYSFSTNHLELARIILAAFPGARFVVDVVGRQWGDSVKQGSVYYGLRVLEDTLRLDQAVDGPRIQNLEKIPLHFHDIDKAFATAVGLVAIFLMYAVAKDMPLAWSLFLLPVVGTFSILLHGFWRGGKLPGGQDIMRVANQAMGKLRSELSGTVAFPDFKDGGVGTHISEELSLARFARDLETKFKGNPDFWIATYPVVSDVTRNDFNETRFKVWFGYTGVRDVKSQKTEGIYLSTHVKRHKTRRRVAVVDGVDFAGSGEQELLNESLPTFLSQHLFPWLAERKFESVLFSGKKELVLALLQNTRYGRSNQDILRTLEIMPPEVAAASVELKLSGFGAAPWEGSAESPMASSAPAHDERIQSVSSAGFGAIATTNKPKIYRTLFVSGERYRKWIEEAVLKEGFPFRTGFGAAEDLRIVVVDKNPNAAEMTAEKLRKEIGIRPNQVRSGFGIDAIADSWLLNGDIYPFSGKMDIPIRFHENVVENAQAYIDYIIYLAESRLAVSKMVAKAA